MTAPATWTSLEAALEHVSNSDVDGIGFVFTDDDPFGGVDLDDCRDPNSGAIDNWARDVILSLDSYSEVSPSGTGVHVIAEGALPDGRSRSGDIEMYETSRYFTVTGNHLDQTPKEVKRRSDELRSIHEDHVDSDGEDGEVSDRSDSSEAASGATDLDDAELLERARAAENGDRFDVLWRGRPSGYPSQSQADMALCLLLAFWTGGDRSRIDRLFRRSGLKREKWDEVHFADGATYGERTIERALEEIEEVYEPDHAVDHRTPLQQRWKTANESTVETHEAQLEGDGTVYLQERNRLLQETVRTQQQTIDRQSRRIADLETELETLRSRLVIAERGKDSDAESTTAVQRIREWVSEV